MNILFLTQGLSLAVFFDVMKSMKITGSITGAGYYIADSAFYNEFRKEQPAIDSGDYILLKEWEIIEQSANRPADIAQLLKYENMYGDPVLWNALLADRRIYLGKKTTIEQDYQSRFTHERMLAILQTGIQKMEELFDRVRPDAVCGFICVTIGEYLAYLISRKRNIPFLDLRPTRIKNLFYAGESVHEPSEALGRTYSAFVNEGIHPDLRQEASEYLASVRRTHAMYEGVLPADGGVNKSRPGTITKVFSGVLSMGRRIKRYYDYNGGEFRQDNHYINDIHVMLNKLKKPLRIKYTDLFLKNHYIDKNKLESMQYAFYPLHKEPEVTLLVYGRPFMNQIEVIRNLARSLPVGMKLIVKEHPASKGYRALSYYQKILAIPNVLLAPIDMKSRELVHHAEMVAVIGGSVGLEALMMKKPVFHFGNVPFSMLPDSMIKRSVEPDNMALEIKQLLDNHSHDEEALTAYISAVMKMSVPVNFYTVLLGRKGVYNPGASDVNEKANDEIRLDHIRSLAGYLEQRLKDFKQASVSV